MRAITFLLDTKQQLDQGKSLEACVQSELEVNRSIAGFGRPLVNSDERNAHMLTRMEQLKIEHGTYLKLAFAIEELLFAGRWRMKMNYGGMAAALCADMGMSPREYYYFRFPAFLAGMQPCFIEANDKPEGALYPIACSDIDYTGQPYRKWEKINQNKET